MKKKKTNNVSAMELPYFYISSAVKYVSKKGEKNDGRSSNKVCPNHRKST